MKDCKFCDKKGLMILPLRYAAVMGEESKKILPTLPSTLGDNVSDLTLANGKYAPRLLRQGYLYILIKRAGLLYWEAYAVIGDAFLYKFPAESPPQIFPEFSCDRSVCGIDASVIAIGKIQFVEKIYLLFTPGAMTVAKLKEYKADPDGKVNAGQMQVFDPKAWIAGGTAQKHSMKPEQLGSHVPEFMLYKQCAKAEGSTLGNGMCSQLFPAIDAAYSGAPAPSPDLPAPGRLGLLEHKMKTKKAAVFVVHDHIGVTQELNDFRNAPIEGFEHYLAATDEYGASNLQRLQVYEALEEVRVGFENGIVQNHQSFIDQHKQSSDQWFDNQLYNAQALRQMGRVADAELVENEVVKSKKRREENYKKGIAEGKENGINQWTKKYKSRLDAIEMELFKKTLDSRSAAAFSAADNRFDDHLKWFESNRLVNAFDTFDQNAQTSGYEFAIESAICSFGLSGCKIGADKIDTWVQAPSVERKNLYMRGYYHNQKELIDAAKQAYTDIQAVASTVTEASAITGAMMLKAAKGLIDGFKKTDSAFDEWARNQDQLFSKKWIEPSMLGKVSGKKLGLELILFHKVSEITRTIFRKGLGGKGDVFLIARLSGALYARLGKVAEGLRYDELMLKIDKSKLVDGYKGRSSERNTELAGKKNTARAASQIKGELAPSLEDLVADAQAKNKLAIKLENIVGEKNQITNNYHQTRIGVVLGCIELIGLGEKMSHAKLGTKSALEIGGSVMAVGSIVLDVYYSAAKSIREIDPYKANNAINKAGDIVRGGFKLGAGVLGMGAGLCGAILDFNKMMDEKEKENSNNILVVIYAARAATGFVSAGLTIITAFSYSQNLCKHLANGYAKHQLRYQALIQAGRLAANLAARVRLLVLVARMNWIGLALTAVEIGYLVFKDDDLQNWCEMSVFRKVKTSKNWIGRMVAADRYENGKAELEQLEKGSRSIGIGAQT